jgi:hypothetical protein
MTELTLRDLQGRIKTAPFKYPLSGIQGWLQPDEQHVLYVLARYLDGPVLEIGSWVGLSTACLAYGVRDSGLARHLVTTDLNPSSQHFRRTGEHFDFLLPGDSLPRGSCDLLTYRRLVQPVIKQPGRALGLLRRNLLRLGLLGYLTILEGDFSIAPDLGYHLIFCDATHTPYETELTAQALQRFLIPGMILACHDVNAANESVLRESISFQDTFQVDTLFVGQISNRDSSQYIPAPLAQPKSTSCPLVSVIIPTYNRAHLLARAVISVLHQIDVDFEVIVVDDASTDSTYSVLEKLADPRLHVLRHATRRGAAAARNTGIQASQGRFIAFLDSDDEWLPNMLTCQVQHFTPCLEKIGVIFTSFQQIRGRNINVVPGRLRAWLSYLPVERLHLSGDLAAALPCGNFITLQAAMVRRECFEQVGLFDECLPRLQDWELWLRIARHYMFVWINLPLAIIYDTPGNISSDPQALRKAIQLILEKHGGSASQELAAHCNFILGDLCMQQKELVQGRFHLKHAIQQSPTTLLYWIAIIAAFAGPRAYGWLKRLVGIGY